MKKYVGILAQLLSFLAFSWANIISTTTGDIEGKPIVVLGQSLDVYLGIRYGEPPIGELRYKPPVPAKPWDGVYNATSNAPSCMQIQCPDNCSEDCLFLNIWVPKNQSGAVMVFYHGGAFMFGSMNSINGSVIASMGSVILASINYRLGPFGFLCSGTEEARGNMGMKDQVLGLKWINDNIEAFGGDPSKITIFGQSAGSQSVSTHLVSPMTKGLFQYAIMESGSMLYFPSNLALNSSLMKWRSNKLAMTLFCANEERDIENDPNVMQCMKERDASSIITAESVITLAIFYGIDNPWYALFTPVYEEEYLPFSGIQEIAAGNFHVDTIMIGNVFDEGSIFLATIIPLLMPVDNPIVMRPLAASFIRSSFRGFTNPTPELVVDYYLANTSFFDSSLLKRAYDSIGDWLLQCPSVFLTEYFSAFGKSVYYYIFNHRWSNSAYRRWMGVVHSDELNFVFGEPFMNGGAFTTAEREFSSELIVAWTSFAKEGKPTYSKLTGDWPLSNGSRIAVDLNPYNVSYVNPYKDACQFWKQYV